MPIDRVHLCLSSLAVPIASVTPYLAMFLLLYRFALASLFSPLSLFTALRPVTSRRRPCVRVPVPVPVPVLFQLLLHLLLLLLLSRTTTSSSSSSSASTASSFSSSSLSISESTTRVYPSSSSTAHRFQTFLSLYTPPPPLPLSLLSPLFSSRPIPFPPVRHSCPRTLPSNRARTHACSRSHSQPRRRCRHRRHRQLRVLCLFGLTKIVVPSFLPPWTALLFSFAPFVPHVCIYEDGWCLWPVAHGPRPAVATRALHSHASPPPPVCTCTGTHTLNRPPRNHRQISEQGTSLLPDSRISLPNFQRLINPNNFRG